MKGGTLLLVLADVVAVLKAQGIITDAGDFDDTKFNDLAEITAVISAVEAALVKHGVAIPGKVDAIIKLLPLLAALAR